MIIVLSDIVYYLNFFLHAYYSLPLIISEKLDFFTMSRLCRFYHQVPKDAEKCYQGHYLCATLDCQVRNCKYTTRPFSMSDTKPAIEMMKLHMIGAHPNLRDALNPTEKDNDNDIQKKINEKPRQERDPDKDETCPKCFKIFFNKKNMKRHLLIF